MRDTINEQEPSKEISKEQVEEKTQEESKKEENQEKPAEEMRNAEEDVSINRFKLEEESERQSSLYLYWSDQLTEAKYELDRSKTLLKIMKAEKQLHYRENPLEGIKPTESSITAMVDKDKDVINARGYRSTCQSAVDNINGVVTSLEHKRSQLKILADLFIAGYYAVPSGTPHTKSDDQAEQVRDKLNKEEDKSNG
jgi:hypothetical protein